MSTSTEGRIGMACLFPCVLLMASVQLPRAWATPPFPATVIRLRDGKWQLQDEYLGGSRIFVIDAQGRTTLLLWIRDALSEQDYQKYVQDTTAGPLWADYALSYFITLNGKPHFCARTWWDRRILIDLEAAKQVSEQPFERALEISEKRQALDTLKAGAVFMARWQEATLDRIHAVHAAVHLAGRMKLKEATRLLKQLETADYSDGCVVSGGMDFSDLRKGDINPSSHCIYSTRRVVQRSLRQLGEKPACHPATLFRYEGKDRNSRKDFEPKKTDEPRHERLPGIEKGMKPVDVLRVLGAPDYVESSKDLWGCAWRYDLDASEPYTLLVIWDDRAQIRALEKVEPALWGGNDLIGPGAKYAVFRADGSVGWSWAKSLYSSDFKGKIKQLK